MPGWAPLRVASCSETVVRCAAKAQARQATLMTSILSGPFYMFICAINYLCTKPSAKKLKGCKQSKLRKIG
jgi:hypothetical protein